jgi:hypothetical protein
MIRALILSLALSSGAAQASLLPHDATDLCFGADAVALRCTRDDVAFWLRKSDLLEAMQNAGPAPQPEPKEIKPDGWQPSPMNAGIFVGVQTMIKQGMPPDGIGGLIGAKLLIKNFEIHTAAAEEGAKDSKRVGGGYFLAIPVFTRYGAALVDGKEVADAKITSQKGLRFSVDYGETARLEAGRERFVQLGTEFVVKGYQANVAIGAAYERSLGWMKRFTAEDGTLIPEPGAWKNGLRLTANFELMLNPNWFPRAKARATK